MSTQTEETEVDTCDFYLDLYITITSRAMSQPEEEKNSGEFEKEVLTQSSFFYDSFYMADEESIRDIYKTGGPELARLYRGMELDINVKSDEHLAEDPHYAEKVIGLADLSAYEINGEDYIKYTHAVILIGPRIQHLIQSALDLLTKNCPENLEMKEFVGGFKNLLSFVYNHMISIWLTPECSEYDITNHPVIFFDRTITRLTDLYENLHFLLFQLQQPRGSKERRYGVLGDDGSLRFELYLTARAVRLLATRFLSRPRVRSAGEVLSKLDMLNPLLNDEQMPTLVRKEVDVEVLDPSTNKRVRFTVDEAGD